MFVNSVLNKGVVNTRRINCADPVATTMCGSILSSVQYYHL